MRLFIISFCLWFLGCSALQVTAQRKVSITTLLTGADLCLDSIPMGVIPGFGLMGAFGNELVTLDPDKAVGKISVAIPDSVEIEEFITAGKRIVMKTGNSVIWIDNEQQKFDGITFEDSDFKISNTSDSTIFLLRGQTDTLFEIDLNSKKTIFATRFNAPPVAAFRLKAGLLVVTRHNILINDRKQWISALHHPTEILHCESTPYGLFFGTSDALWRLVAPDNIELVATGSVCGIYSNDTSIYIVDSHSNLLRMDY